MNRRMLVFALAFALAPLYGKAQVAPAVQNPQESAADRAVHITQGPTISNLGANSATISWQTDSNAATEIRYRGADGAWHSAYVPGGSTNHQVTLNGLQPGQNYEFQVMTRDQQVRTAGSFQTPASGAAAVGTQGGTAGAAAASGSGYERNENRNAVGDRDQDNRNAVGDRDQDNRQAVGDRDQDNRPAVSGQDQDRDQNRAVSGSDKDRDQGAYNDQDQNRKDKDKDKNKDKDQHDRGKHKGQHKDKDKNKDQDRDNNRQPMNENPPQR